MLPLFIISLILSLSVVGQIFGNLKSPPLGRYPNDTKHRLSLSTKTASVTMADVVLYFPLIKQKSSASALGD